MCCNGSRHGSSYQGAIAIASRRVAANYGIAAEAAGLPACVTVVVKDAAGAVVDAERWLRLPSAARGDGVVEPGQVLRRSFVIGATSEQAKCKRLVVNGTAPNGTWEVDTDADWPGGLLLLRCAPRCECIALGWAWPHPRRPFATTISPCELACRGLLSAAHLPCVRAVPPTAPGCLQLRGRCGAPAPWKVHGGRAGSQGGAHHVALRNSVRQQLPDD